MNHSKQFQSSLHSLTLYIKPPSSPIFSTTRHGSEIGGLEVILLSICRSLDRDFWLNCQQRFVEIWRFFFPSFRLHCVSKLWFRNVLANQNQKYLNGENNKGNKDFSLVRGLLLLGKMLYRGWGKHMKSRVKKLLGIHCYSYFIIKLYNSYS